MTFNLNRIARVAAPLAAGFVALAFAQGAAGQAYPAKPVSLVVPNPPGGSMDIQGQLYKQKLQEMWGQTVIIDYKAGGGTLIGMDHVAKAAPDGYVIGMAVTPMVIFPALRKDMPYDTVRDLAGVSLTAASSIMIAGSPKLAANTAGEVIALAKKSPGKLTYGTAGAGSSMHLAFELFKQQTGIDILHVPFKGGAQAYPELMAGRIDLLLDPTFGVGRYVRAGKIKGIAVTSLKRDPTFPEVASVAETLPGFEVLSINGIIVPRATPRPLVNRLNADFRKLLATPDMVKRLAELGLNVVASSPEEFDSFIRTEIARWTKVARTADIKLD